MGDVDGGDLKGRVEQVITEETDRGVAGVKQSILTADNVEREKAIDVMEEVDMLKSREFGEGAEGAP